MFILQKSFEESMKPVETLSQDMPLGREPNAGPTDYDAAVLTTQPRLLIITSVNKITYAIKSSQATGRVNSEFLLPTDASSRTKRFYRV
jgi:hypothetical protein